MSKIHEKAAAGGGTRSRTDQGSGGWVGVKQDRESKQVSSGAELLLGGRESNTIHRQEGHKHRRETQLSPHFKMFILSS